MKTINFPYLALPLCLFLLLIVNRGSQAGTDGDTALPLLTLLIINECAFFLAIAGAFIGIRHLWSINFKVRLNPLYAITTVICILLSIQIALLGIKLWPV